MGGGALTRGQRTRDHRVKDGRFSTRDASSGGPPAFDPFSLTWDRYYDYSDASSVTLNGADISQINDLSGNTAHASQAAGTAQPLYALAAQNGLNVGTFVNTNRLVTGDNWTRAQPFMTFTVARYEGPAAAGTIYIWSAAGGTIYIRKITTTDYWGGFAGSPAFNSTVVADNNFHVFCCAFNGASSYLMMDGVLIASASSGNTNAPSAAHLAMGGVNGLGSSWLGSIGHCSFGPVQSDADRDAMVTHLTTKWGI